MKWNSDWTGWQQTHKGTARARRYYFVTNRLSDSGKWQAGYHGFRKDVIMESAGEFDTSADARAYCEKVDREAVIIEGVGYVYSSRGV